MNQREARVWNFWNRDDTAFFPVRLWPPWAQELLLQEHRNNNERYRLATFLLCNGLFPPLVEEAVLGWDVHRRGDRLIPQQGNYDENAKKDVRGLLLKYQQGHLSEHTYYDMTLRRVVKNGVEQLPPGQRE